MKVSSVEEFYNNIRARIPEGISREIGHFNVFNIADLYARFNNKPAMPYDRRAYYKISLINGRNKAEYADKVIDIERHGLLFASPKVPYHYVPQDIDQSGWFCIFTEDFLRKNNSGVALDEL